MKFKNWHINNKATTEAAKVESVTSQFEFYQIIKGPA